MIFFQSYSTGYPKFWKIRYTVFPVSRLLGYSGMYMLYLFRLAVGPISLNLEVFHLKKKKVQGLQKHIEHIIWKCNLKDCFKLSLSCFPALGHCVYLRA